MCGIFGYVHYSTDKRISEVLAILFNGLKSLEYRGYDSAGVCVDAPADAGVRAPVVMKAQGKVSALQAKADAVMAQKYAGDGIEKSGAGIGHTRWATHGPPSPTNSHPHVSDETSQFVVVHNGIITNYAELKAMLIHHGAVFVSETDTEVVPKLCKLLYDQCKGDISFTELVMEVMGRLEGAFALLLKSTHFPGELIAAKRGSPLIMGVKKQVGDSAAMECWLASDAAALLPHTRNVVVLEDNDLLHITVGNYAVYSCGRSHNEPHVLRPAISRVIQTIDMEVEAIMKNGYDHYMQKEIHEQPKTLADTMRGRLVINKPLTPMSSARPSFSNSADFDSEDASLDSTPKARPLTQKSIGKLDLAVAAMHISKSTLALCATSEPSIQRSIRLGGLADHMDSIKRCRRLVFVACGTSFHSCMAVRKTIEEFAGMAVTLELASDLMDREAPIFRDDACVFVSQSGETADTLRALDYAKSKGAMCIGITNTVGSAISRNTHCGVHLNAGYEIGVASTKAYTSQVLVMTMMALMLGEDSVSKSTKRESIIKELEWLPDRVSAALKLDGPMKELAGKLKDIDSLLFFARGYNYATALEAALKVKEVALVHSEGINAGEMKHGPLALVDEHMPILVVATKDAMYGKMQSVIQQLLARSARLIILCNENDESMQKYKAKGCDLIEVPATEEALQPIVNIVPLQLLSYHLTTIRGYDVDQPRNLAKSVTVTED